MSGQTTPSGLDALQAAIDGENAAVFGYGQAAGALAAADLTRARSLLDAHRSRRDRLRTLVVDTSASPTAAAPAYAMPSTANAAAARAALAGVEERLAAVYADLVAASSGPTRTLAVTGLTESAARAAEWGATLPPFPGLPERATPSTPSATTPSGSPSAP